MVRRQGGALCVVDYRLMHGYVDAREAVWGKGMGQVAGRAQGSKGGSGKGRAVVSPRRITLRKGAAGWQGTAGQERLREGAGGGIASENHFEEGSAGWTGAAGQERLWEGAGC